MVENTNTFKIEGLDLNTTEMQAQGGYVITFLNEHQMIMSAMTNQNGNNRETVSQAIRLKVSLITDDKIREELWAWYDAELEKRLKGVTINDEKVEIKYDIAIVLLGKIMSFVGKHLSKPVEIGTE